MMSIHHIIINNYYYLLSPVQSRDVIICMMLLLRKILMAAASVLLGDFFSTSLFTVSPNLYAAAAPSAGFAPSIHCHHEQRLPKSTPRNYRSSCSFKRLQQQQQQQHLLTIKSWNIVPRGGQQSPSPHTLGSTHSSASFATTATTTLFDGTTLLLSSAAAAETSVSPFLRYNIVIFLVNLLGMLISLIFPGMQYHLDLLGTGSFAVASSYMLLLLFINNGANNAPLASLSSSLQVQVASSIAVIIWSTKLASFLFYRALIVKTDARLESILSTKTGVVLFWFISFVWGVISSLPHSIGLTSSCRNYNNFGLYCGTVVYMVGLIMETAADYQKWMWKQSNPKKFCRTGLWSISQHPNFVGNILIWTGIAVMNFFPRLATTSSSSSSLDSWRMVPIACLSPIVLWRFFLGQAQGVISSGVDLSLKKYGDDPDYRDYIENVPLLFPDLKHLFLRKQQSEK